MRLRVLGSAAGGGFPQWNCDCPCCRAVRDGSRPARPRTQSSVAVSADGDRWVLINASPDIHRQIESFGPLRPRPGRASPITMVLLTDGELDHTLGLVLLREARGVRVGGTTTTRDFLRNGSRLLPTLQAYCPVEWTDVAPGAAIPLGGGLSAAAFDAPTRKKPRFPGVGEGEGRVVGYRITDERTGAVAAILPGVQELTPDVLGEMRGCQAVLIDGTCWSDDEMITLGLASKTSRDMGHVPVSGPGGSLDPLTSLPIERRVYVHLNNTNPLLLEDSPERKEVESRGLEIAHDGLELEI
ncbi:MAG: pyrroloquinoline quinone biosynthesis protein PqqB [Nocardiopsaceae bacterium]|nr:pyrroloquinoline quinone biosynthesis protein PqqB [Nocardiopsaceae bacterium]